MQTRLSPEASWFREESHHGTFSFHRCSSSFSVFSLHLRGRRQVFSLHCRPPAKQRYTRCFRFLQVFRVIPDVFRAPAALFFPPSPPSPYFFVSPSLPSVILLVLAIKVCSGDSLKQITPIFHLLNLPSFLQSGSLCH